MNKNLMFCGLAAAIIVASAAYQGFMTDRWRNEISQRLNVFTQRLEGEPGIPMQVGDWVASEVPVNEAQFKASHCHGRVSRAYRNTVTGEEITVFLVSGKAYHVTIHTPDYCYVAAGFEMDKDPANYTFEAPGIPKPEVLIANFKKVTPTETTRLKVFWTYSEDGKWTAPSLAKYVFSGKPALYKVYLIRGLAGTSPPLSEDPAIQFAKEFLPAINHVLFPDGTAETTVVETADASTQQASRAASKRQA